MKAPQASPPKRQRSTAAGKARSTTPNASKSAKAVTPPVQPKPLKIQARSPEEWLKLAPCLNALVDEYKVPAYIQSDPLQIPYRFAADPKACELVAFITALFSYGRRDLIIETVTNLFRLTDNDPVAFMESFHPKRDAKRFQHFVYRFNKGADLVYLWQRLQWAYRQFGSLEELFRHSLQRHDPSSGSLLRTGIARFTDQLLGDEPPQSYGLKFLFAHPDKGGACKRFNMFLRWMVRQDENTPEMEAYTGKVDLGLWQNSLTPADLLVPLDTHVMKMNRNLRLSARTDNSWQTAEEITAIFRLLCPEDPVKYDYALFGFSLDKRSPDEILAVWQ